MAGTIKQNCFTKLHKVVIEFGMQKVLEVLPTLLNANTPLPYVQQLRLKLEEARDIYVDNAE